jgi:hypothetical protein
MKTYGTFRINRILQAKTAGKTLVTFPTNLHACGEATRMAEGNQKNGGGRAYAAI